MIVKHFPKKIFTAGLCALAEYLTSAEKRSICFLLLIPLFFSGCAGNRTIVLEPEQNRTSRECVVLLHGMGRSHRSMVEIQEYLSSQGYYSVNVGYLSTKASVEEIVAQRYPVGLEQCRHFEPVVIHFVTHSLGGIVLRQALQDDKPVELGNVVMLSPPNKGSAIVDRIKTWKIYRWLMGPAGQQLSTGDAGLPGKLGPVDFPLGVITGNTHAFFDYWFSKLIPGPDDGKVAVESAKIEGMQDFLVVNYSHPYIMKSEYVHREIVHFLQHGNFAHKKEKPLPPSGQDWYIE
jgi:triacylglycerol lipase